MVHFPAQIRRFVALTALLMITACAPEFKNPPARQHAWLSGDWSTGEVGWRQDLLLQVGDGNKVRGTFINTSPGGRASSGAVDGTVVGDQVMLQVKMATGTRYQMNLTRIGKLLSGTRSSDTESWEHLFRKK